MEIQGENQLVDSFTILYSKKVDIKNVAIRQYPESGFNHIY